MKAKKLIELKGGPADGELHNRPADETQLAIRPRIKEPIYYYRQSKAKPEITFADQVFEYAEKKED